MNAEGGNSRIWNNRLVMHSSTLSKSHSPPACSRNALRRRASRRDRVNTICLRRSRFVPRVEEIFLVTVEHVIRPANFVQVPIVNTLPLLTSPAVAGVQKKRRKPNFVPLLKKGNLSQIPSDVQEILLLNDCTRSQAKATSDLQAKKTHASRSVGRVGMFSKHGIFAPSLANFAD